MVKHAMAGWEEAGLGERVTRKPAEPTDAEVAGKKAGEARTPEQQQIVDANQTGDRRTLLADSFIPVAMAAIYLLLLLYFKSIGGYRALKLEEQS